MQELYDNNKKSRLTNTTKENYYQVDYANEVTRLNAEKQQLISFLEDRLKEYKLKLLNLKYNIGTTYEEIGKYKGSLQAFQEVLDFVNKGGKK